MIVLRGCRYLHSPEADDPTAGWDVLIDGGRIVEIGLDVDVRRPAVDPGAARSGRARTGMARSGGLGDPTGAPREIDCSHHVVVPGFVNTHHHFYQTLTRNLPAVQDAKLFDWLVYHYDVWRHLDCEAVHVATQLACAELLLTGCTCTTDHHYLYPDRVVADPSVDIMGIQFEAADSLGIRFSPSRGSMSRGRSHGGLPPDSVVQSEEAILDDSARVIERYHDRDPNAMHKVTLAPCSPFSVTPDLLRESARLARVHGVRLHTHLAETADEDDYCVDTHGMRPLELMEECEFIGTDVSYAHGIHFTDGELARLAETGTGVCHCPSSNMRLGSGIARVSEMQRLGVPVSVAVDGSASNDSSDYLGELRTALLLQRVRYGADALGARDVLRMGARGGATMLGFDTCGEIRTGWAADLAVFDVGGIAYAGAQADPLSALLFCGVSHVAAWTIVNGEIVVEDGRLVRLNEADLAKRANAAAAGLRAHAG